MRLGGREGRRRDSGSGTKEEDGGALGDSMGGREGQHQTEKKTKTKLRGVVLRLKLT